MPGAPLGILLKSSAPSCLPSLKQKGQWSVEMACRSLNFSPRHSSNWTVGLRNDWVMFRRYDFGLTHHLTGRAGQYSQAGFDTGDIWSLDYEFQADINKRWGTRFGISRRRNFYDGAHEYATFFRAGLTGRF